MGINEYARDDGTINGIAGFWAFAEEELRDYFGTGYDHSEFYLKEEGFRWNYRFLCEGVFLRKLLETLAHKNEEQLTS